MVKSLDTQSKSGNTRRVHTYSTYARGLDGLWGMYQWIDRAPKGRNETAIWWRRRDEYDKH